jgi:hypothetical protein
MGLRGDVLRHVCPSTSSEPEFAIFRPSAGAESFCAGAPYEPQAPGARAGTNTLDAMDTFAISPAL